MMRRLFTADFESCPQMPNTVTEWQHFANEIKMTFVFTPSHFVSDCRPTHTTTAKSVCVCVRMKN